MARAARVDRGTVTAEIAVGLPSLILVLVVTLGAVQAVATQVACVDAARLAARALARGDPVEAAEGVALASAPADAEIITDIDASHARVVVRAPVDVVVGRTPLTVHGEAATPLEEPP
ncbi:pilus assembly protein [Spiractinospora alimapuensis]|uniref:TadE family type IV pilus minor pilin n=1 Tax=Spiractinospora alimapuensis TaxID=2820884 RepID=UPI001F20A8CF|nr:TadE family type IV pilus minor pilin [Spiractinospora alimapuensis]QVQ50362.1 pilus assembly protein [Spiractinospora alimapuensis]